MPSVAFGQTLTGRNNKEPYYFAAINSPVGTTLIDGSRLICKAGGTAWFASPPSTEVSMQWAGGQYNNTSVGTKCCVCEWPALNACLSAVVCNYVATEWYIPTQPQLCTGSSPIYLCRAFWSLSPNTGGIYWTATENTGTAAPCIWANNNFQTYSATKTNCNGARAFRCVTY